VSDYQPTPRTYGGWRRSRQVGLLGLGPGQSLGVLAAATAVVLAATANPLLLVVTGPPALVTVCLIAIHVEGTPLGAGLLRRIRWYHASLRGHTAYRGGIMVTGPHAWDLPGVLAPTTLIAVTDPTRGDFGLVHNTRLHTLTATLRCAATSTWLADPREAATWVANWASWLADLGYQPDIGHVAISVDTAPDPGTRLADNMSRRILPTAPVSAQHMLRDVVAAAPATGADVHTRVSITFHAPPPATAVASGVDDAVARILRTLPGLQDSLATCGLTVLGRATAADLVAIVRTAYDPAMRGDVERIRHTPGGAALTEFLDWETAGPVSAEEHIDHYEHDTGMSVSWAWHEAPRQNVHHDVLARLIAPGPAPKRVVLLYRPLPARQAATVVEHEVNAAAFRATLRQTQRRDESARDHADRERALRAAREEAIGAGVGLMSLLVTVTVTDPADLPHAVADVEARADTAKIRLRRMRASQATGFATTLAVCGVCPPQLARIWPH
jgi:hypothetical protein